MRVVPTAVLVLVAAATVACSSSTGQTAAGSTTPASESAATPKSTKATAKTQAADSSKREINQTTAVKNRDSSADVTLVSMRESKGKPDDLAPPDSGNYVIIEVAFQGKTGEFFASRMNVKLKKPDGSLVETGDGNGIHATETDATLGSEDLTPGKVLKGEIGYDTVFVPGTKVIVLDSLDKVLAEWPL
jgi:hypothetical protein